MSNKVYAWILAVTLALCVAATVAMMLYAVDAYEHSSIVHYIASERW